jgi:hypothetical protein
LRANPACPRRILQRANNIQAAAANRQASQTIESQNIKSLRVMEGQIWPRFGRIATYGRKPPGKSCRQAPIIWDFVPERVSGRLSNFGTPAA